MSPYKQNIVDNISTFEGQTSILVHGSLMMALSMLAAISLKPPPPEVELELEAGYDVTDAAHPRLVNLVTIQLHSYIMLC